MSDLTYEYPADVVMQRARENRAMHDKNTLLRDVLAQIVGAFTSGIYCANCGEGVELCRCIIDLGRTALGGNV